MGAGAVTGGFLKGRKRKAAVRRIVSVMSVESNTQKEV